MNPVNSLSILLTLQKHFKEHPLLIPHVGMQEFTHNEILPRLLGRQKAGSGVITTRGRSTCCTERKGHCRCHWQSLRAQTFILGRLHFKMTKCQGKISNNKLHQIWLRLKRLSWILAQPHHQTFPFCSFFCYRWSSLPVCQCFKIK